jgi:flagellar biosynthesis GTPase FlhF
LTLAVLTEERSARVWRLNGAGANTAEFLSMHCEMLDVPIDRFWSQTRTPANLHFIDLPGVETDDPRALSALRNELSALPSPEIHLVLNAAYETETLLKQCRVFGALQPADLILTHLDEETRRVKLWNLVFGTNCTILFLSAGQKIPGEFHRAAPKLLFPSETSQQQADPPLQR